MLLDSSTIFAMHHSIINGSTSMFMLRKRSDHRLFAMNPLGAIETRAVLSRPPLLLIVFIHYSSIFFESQLPPVGTSFLP